MTSESFLREPSDDFDVDWDDEGCLIYSAVIATRDGGNMIVTVDSMLSPMDNIGEIFEFSFSIGAVWLDDSQLPFSTQDGRISNRYIPAACRPHVMPTVLNALRRMVEQVQPQVIYRVTKSQHTPSRAMSKHELLTQMLQDMGYEIIDSETDALGRRFWMMQSN